MYQLSQKLCIKHWAEEDRPREKLLLKGKSALSDAELLAIIIGSGNSEQSAVELAKYILAECNNDLEIVSKLSIKKLMQFKGIGEAKGIAIIASLELARRIIIQPVREIEQIKCSKDIYNLFYVELANLEIEEFWLLTLAKNNKVIDKHKISVGGVAQTLVDAKIVFNKALYDLSSHIVLIHNHPSGNKQPSEQDIQLTQKLTKAAQLLDIHVLDHLIITKQDYFSFSDNNLL